MARPRRAADGRGRAPAGAETARPRRLPTAAARAGGDVGWMRRGRPVLALLCGCAAAVFVGGAAGLVAGVLGRGRRLVGASAGPSHPTYAAPGPQVRRDLPHLVQLLAASLRSGMSPGDGVRVVCAALPGAAADRLAAVTERLALGVDPEQVWAALGRRRGARAARPGAGPRAPHRRAGGGRGRAARRRARARRPGHGRGTRARGRRPRRAAARSVPAAVVPAARDRPARRGPGLLDVALRRPRDGPEVVHRPPSRHLVPQPRGTAQRSGAPSTTLGPDGRTGRPSGRRNR